MSGETPVEIRVQGLEELQANLDAVGKKLDTAVKAELRSAGVYVRDEVRALAARFGPTTTRQIRSRFRGGSLYVESAARKSDNPAMRRPNFAPLLSSVAFGPAAQSAAPEVFAKIETAVDSALSSEGL